MKNKIIYFDPVIDSFKKILLENKPDSFGLLFWDELCDQEKKELLPKADYLMVATKEIGKVVIESAKEVKLIQKTGIGVDNIDLGTANQLKVPVSNTPGANASGVAELTILLILSLYRKLPLLNKATKDGRWLMWEYRSSSYEMNGKTHGFIGFGTIGQETAKRSKAFGTNIIYYDPFRISEENELDATYMSINEVLEKSDIVSLHLPLHPETENLITHRELTMMKNNAILINVSRGGIVDENALAKALRNGDIAGAGIDVWESEPPKIDHPLFKLENVITTPHIGAGTHDTLQRVLNMAFTNIGKVNKGEDPDYVVNNIKQARITTKK